MMVPNENATRSIEDLSKKPAETKPMTKEEEKAAFKPSTKILNSDDGKKQVQTTIGQYFTSPKQQEVIGKTQDLQEKPNISAF